MCGSYAHENLDYGKKYGDGHQLARGPVREGCERLAEDDDVLVASSGSNDN
jgi:tetraacyldisaccharide-1-P 4'-kinase